MTTLALQRTHIPWRPILTTIAAIWLLWVWLFLIGKPIGVDTRSYWLIDQHNLYGRAMNGEEYRYLYSPVFAQLVGPLTALPWPVFNALWLTASMGALIYMLGPIGAGLILLVPTSPVWWELSAGNIHLLLAAAIVAGFRHPSAWGFVLLTKVTPGVGLLWFALRREWQALRVAALATLVLVVVSILLGGFTPWRDWLTMLASVSDGPGPYNVAVPLAVRLSIAVAIVAIGAWRGWAWTVPVAAMLALPLLWMWHSFSMLVGALALSPPLRRVVSLDFSRSRRIPTALSSDDRQQGGALAGR